MNKAIQRTALTCLLCSGLQSFSQTPPSTVSAPIETAPQFVFTWKPNTRGCDDKFLNGVEIEEQFTSQATVMAVLVPDLGKLAVRIGVWNPEKSTSRIEVIPENVHLLRVSDKGLAEESRTDATKMAKSMERRQRVGAALSGFGAGMSQTTASGNATYSDGTTATYQVTMPNTQAQSDAIEHGRAKISEAQDRGAYAVAAELKRNTLGPGENTIGQLFFPKQKKGEDLLVEVDIGNVRYAFPFSLSKKTGTPISRETTPNPKSQPLQQAKSEPAIETSQNQLSASSPKEPIGKPQPANTNYDSAIATYRGAADLGDATAQFNLGLLYAKGQGVQQDFVEAARWYAKAANQGNADAQEHLGTLYYRGRGVPQDYAQAALEYRKAADQGNARAQSMLGELYYYGRGVPQDNDQMAAWIRKAAEQGYVAAENNLGDLYENGHGVLQDYAQAATWYRKAADQGSASAQFGLGSLYETGHGMSAARSRGSRRFRPEFWIPTSKYHFQFFVEHFGPCLEQEMCSTESPLHLLLLDEPSADHLIDRRLNECRTDPFALSPSLAEVWNELAVVFDVDLEFGQPVGNFCSSN
jgi:TPR repeat protein